MQFKRFLGIIAFLGALAYEAHADYSVTKSSTNTTHIPTTDQRDIKNLLDIFCKPLKPQKCTNEATVKLFKELQDELDINPYLELLETKEPPSPLPNNTAAYYDSPTHTVTIVSSIFDRIKPILKKYVLYHELRHHLQNTRYNAKKDVILYVFNKNITFLQAIEHDADFFAIQKVSKNCPYCVKEIKRDFPMFRPFLSKNYQGYFTHKDFNNVLVIINKNPKYCQKHSTHMKCLKFWLSQTAYYLSKITGF